MKLFGKWIGQQKSAQGFFYTATAARPEVRHVVHSPSGGRTWREGSITVGRCFALQHRRALGTAKSINFMDLQLDGIHAAFTMKSWVNFTKVIFGKYLKEYDTLGPSGQRPFARGDVADEHDAAVAAAECAEQSGEGHDAAAARASSPHGRAGCCAGVHRTEMLDVTEKVILCLLWTSTATAIQATAANVCSF
ncbi:hypothetical protein B0H13DRAFT_1856271 [Mycena leptocephala]|nr:hypothetical protein B0H13DRAFT_1856271 [Mycena leptocephala]